MSSPVETIKQLATQFGWAEEMLGEEFWSNVLGSLKGMGQQAAAPPFGAGQGQGPGPGPTPGPAAPARPAPFPPLDIYGIGQELVLTAALPGLASPEHAAVYLTGPRELVLEAFIQPEPSVGMVLLRERPTGYVTRTVTLPAAVAPQGARVRFEDGILEIRLPVAGGAPADGGISVIQVTPP